MKTAIALLVTFLLSWAFAGLYFWMGGNVHSWEFPIFGMLYMWVPGLCALGFARYEKISLPIWKKPGWPELTAVAAPILLFSAAILLGLPFAERAPMALGWDSLSAIFISTIIAGATINALAALGEELFWRGYLHAKLRRHGILKASLIIGLFWGLWHAPFVLKGYNYQHYHIAGVGMMVLVTLTLSPILFALREADSALMAPSMFHGTFNALGGLTFLFFTNPNPLIVGVTGILAILLYGVAALFAIRWNQLKRL